jgi:DNA polymerase III epsilon subunit-like protein
MFDTDSWVILDTETTGFHHPVYPVEIAAQRMLGWCPHGAPFRVLVNFDVPIEPGAEKVHGYSRDYLRSNGRKPDEALAGFLTYVGKSPVVAYNLNYDCGTVLAPTIRRMGMRSQLLPGFCALDLTRNVVPLLPNFKLKTVIKTFGISQKQEHNAAGDVTLVVRLLCEFIGPHLAQSGVQGFERIATCSVGRLRVPPLIVSNAPRKTKAEPGYQASVDDDLVFAIGELVGICRMIALDRKLSSDEFNFLSHWLEQCPYAGTPPISQLYEAMREILADGQVSLEEQQKLIGGIEMLLAWYPNRKSMPE